MARKSKDPEAAKARLSHVVEQTVAEQRRLKSEGFGMAIDRLKRADAGDMGAAIAYLEDQRAELFG